MTEDFSVYKSVIDTLIALGTVGAVWAAIWGDRLRRRLFSPSLGISLVDDVGELTKDGAGNPLLVFHLRVTNFKPDYPAEDVEAHLVEVWRKPLTGAFRRTVMVTPRRFLWAPRELNPPAVPIYDEAVLDFGVFQLAPLAHVSSNCFAPWLLNFPNNFDGLVSAGETVRYVIQVRAKNVRRPARTTIEVFWDGTWSGDAESMKQHLTIRQLGQTGGTA